MRLSPSIDRSRFDALLSSLDGAEDVTDGIARTSPTTASGAAKKSWRGT